MKRYSLTETAALVREQPPAYDLLRTLNFTSGQFAFRVCRWYSQLVYQVARNIATAKRKTSAAAELPQPMLSEKAV